MEPADAAALPEAIQAIARAEVIVLGPGSLYTSIIPNLLFPEIVKAILASRARKIYISNIMTQPAETLGYDAADHVRAMLSHAGLKNARGLIDLCLTNSGWIEPALIAKYQLESAVPVTTDRNALEALDVSVLEAPLAIVSNGVIRHDHTLLARLVLSLGLGQT
jgi:uncharacterized cofD-like protein